MVDPTNNRLAVSDEATIASLDDFREAHAARLDPRGRPASDDATILAIRDGAWPAKLHDVEELEEVIAEEHAHKHEDAQKGAAA